MDLLGIKNTTPVATSFIKIDFFRRHVFALFLVAWLVIVAITIGAVGFYIKQKLDAPLPVQQAVETKLAPLRTTLFDKSAFINLRTIASRPGEGDYTKCLNAPGRPSIFTPFVPCQ